MEIRVKATTLETEPCDALILGVPQDTSPLNLSRNERLKKACSELLATEDFKGKLNETSLLYTPNLSAKRLLLVGLGEREKYDLEHLRQAVGTAAKTLGHLGQLQIACALETFLSEKFTVAEAAQSATEGMILAVYKYTAFKQSQAEDTRQVEKVVFLIENATFQKQVKEGVRWGQIVAEAVNFARDLQNHPANWVTPTRLAELAQEMAKEVGLKCVVLNKAEMEKLKMGALLGVARGSQEPPTFIILEHSAGKQNLETIVLVGKGVTFDSGGISIKPSERMEEMKFDMSGGAVVMGAMKAIAQLKMPFHVVGLVPAVENLPSGTSMKPGDILRASSGTTIEIINTDAEGRVILADALTYAKRYKPKAVIDLATLTGACVVALGPHASGLFSTDSELRDAIKSAAEKAGERVWPFPLWDDYHDDIKSDYADIKNSAGRAGGAITAAAFLSQFAEGYPWAHLDIAGTAWTDKEKAYISKGGTGWGVRLLLQFLKDRIQT
jgi:leucyl aminopeptidase